MTKGKTKKKLQKGLCLGAFLAAMSLNATFCCATEFGSIQIEYHGRTQTDDEVALNQAGFTYYYVGTMQDGQWTTTGEFDDASVSLEGDSSSERGKQAEQLNQYAEEKKIQGSFVETDYNGIAAIPNLKQGLYLIAQTRDWTSESIGTFRSAPFLVSVPSMEDGLITWNVVVKPKSEWVADDGYVPIEPEKPAKPEVPEKHPKPENPEHVKTGDATSFQATLVLLMGSLIIIWMIIYKKQKNV